MKASRGDAQIPATVALALSVTHQHLLSVVATESEPPAEARPVRILDAGCGDGRLLDYVARNLSGIYPDATFEFHGFDVSDHGVQLLSIS